MGEPGLSELSSGLASRMPAGAPEEARHAIAGALTAADGDAGLLLAALVMRDGKVAAVAEEGGAKKAELVA
jgi:hypothetical protein